MKQNYGKELADVIVNICGNIIVGQANGEIAKQVSERLGKTLQDRESISFNSGDTSISRSKQLEIAVPVSTISSLSAGEFVGMVADNPDEIIELKTFHAMIVNDHEALRKEKANYVPLPIVRRIDQKEVNTVYQIIKQDVQDIIESMMEEILNNPEREHLVVRKN